MDIEQVQKDMDNGVIVSRATYKKLVKAALIQKAALDAIINTDDKLSFEIANDAAKEIEAL